MKLKNMIPTEIAHWLAQLGATPTPRAVHQYARRPDLRIAKHELADKITRASMAGDRTRAKELERQRQGVRRAIAELDATPDTQTHH